MKAKLAVCAVAVATVGAGSMCQADVMSPTFLRKFARSYAEERARPMRDRAADEKEGKAVYAITVLGTYVDTDGAKAFGPGALFTCDTSNTSRNGQFSYMLRGGLQRIEPDGAGGEINQYTLGGDLQLLRNGRWTLVGSIDTASLGSIKVNQVGGEIDLDLGDREAEHPGLFDKLTLVGSVGRERLRFPTGAVRDTTVGGQVIYRFSKSITLVAEGETKNDINGDTDFLVSAIFPLIKKSGVSARVGGGKNSTWFATVNWELGD